MEPVEQHGVRLRRRWTLKNILGYRKVTPSAVSTMTARRQINQLQHRSFLLLNSQNALDGDQWSDEFQVLGQALDDRLDWITGAFWFEEDNYDDQRSDLFGRRANIGTGTNESKSLFAQGNVFT